MHTPRPAALLGIIAGLAIIYFWKGEINTFTWVAVVTVLLYYSFKK